MAARRSGALFGLCAIVLLGAALRLFPIWFGLPYMRARPDEEVAIGHAVAVLGGDLNPHFFHWPSLIFYVFAALFAAASWVRRALLLDPALTDVEMLVLGRSFVALAGTLTIVVLFGLARRIAGATTGVLAAGFLAAAILHVRDSHFAMTDVLMTLLVTASLALLLRALDTTLAAPRLDARLRPVGFGGQAGAVWWFAAAGLVGGLAASTKYSAAAIVAGMGAAQLLCLAHSKTAVWRPQAWIPSAAFLVAFGCGFIVATPYALLDFERFAADFQFNFTHLSEGHAANLGRGWSYHLKRSLPYGVGVPVFIAAIVGFVPLVRDYPRQAFVMGAYAGAFYAWIGSGYATFFRYILPVVPIVCVSAAVAVRHAGLWLASRTGVSTGVCVALPAVFIGVPALVNSVWFDVLLAKTDTRVLAERWLIPRVRPEDSLHDAGSGYAQLDLSRIPAHVWYFDPATNSFGHPEGHTPDWLVIHESPLWTYARVPPELRRLAAEKYMLVQIVRGTKGRPKKQRLVGAAVYDLQDAFFLPISGFSTVERPGPTILIYRRGDTPPTSANSPQPSRRNSWLR